MDDIIYRVLTSIGRQDLANNYILIISEKEKNDARLADLETAIVEIEAILTNRQSAIKNIEQIALELKGI